MDYEIMIPNIETQDEMYDIECVLYAVGIEASPDAYSFDSYTNDGYPHSVFVREDGDNIYWAKRTLQLMGYNV